MRLPSAGWLSSLRLHPCPRLPRRRSSPAACTRRAPRGTAKTAASKRRWPSAQQVKPTEFTCVGTPGEQTAAHGLLTWLLWKLAGTEAEPCGGPRKTASLPQAGDTTESGPPKVEQKFKLRLRSPVRSCDVIPGRGSSLQAGLGVCISAPSFPEFTVSGVPGRLLSVQPD